MKKREEKIQFLEKIPKILANIARVSLIALALAHDYAQCDVVPAKPQLENN